MVKISRRTIVLLVLALLLVAGIFFVFTDAGSGIARYYENRKAEAEIERMEKPYREDIYGGSTPEETYGLFIKALKEENIELAAKYFVPKRQAEWQKELRFQKEQNKLGEFIESLPDLTKLEKNISEDREYIEYSLTDFTKIKPSQIIKIDGKNVTLPGRHVTYEVDFIRNTYTNKWKIESL